MSSLKVTLVQTDIIWKDKSANLAIYANKLAAYKNKTDLVVLPEMFATGFSTDAVELGEPTNGQIVAWMKQQARELNAVVAGSVILSTGNKHYNSFCFAFPDGTLERYNKRHLFRMGKEHEHFAAGDERKIIWLKGWRICPLVCYDLRFPVWARNRHDYDLLLYTANWPAARRLHWKTLLQARAIENQAFTIGLNRIGTDGNGYEYAGESAVYAATGDLLSQDAYNKEYIDTVELNRDLLMAYRKKFPASMDADSFEIQD